METPKRYKKLTPTIATLSTVAFLFSTLFAPLAEASLLTPSAPLKNPTTPMHFSDLGQLSYDKQGQSGLKRKVKSAWTTGAVTTVSDVEVLEYDGFGRQVHTVVTSQRNDINKTWTRTETLVKSFDDQGRVKDVRRTTDSKLTLPKSSGGFLGGLGGLVVGALLAVTGVGLLVAIAVGAAVGLGGAAANWLGGQKMYSHNVVDQTMAYKADGRVDEEKTKAQTRTLEEKSYMMGQNFGDKMMMASDIMVAVAAVVTTVMTAGAATGFWAAVGASLISLAPTVAYQAARQGISINDFEAHPDRENARNSRMMVVNYVGQSLLAGLGSSLRLSQGTSYVKNSTEWLDATNNLDGIGKAYFGIASVGYSMLSAAAGGATGKTLLTVGAISAANGLLGGYNVSSGGGKPWVAGAGEFIRQAGMTYGKSSQRTTWMLVGTGVSSASGSTAQVIGTVGKSFALNLYSKHNSGGTDQVRYQRGFVLQSLGELAGTLTGIGVDSFNRSFDKNKTQGKFKNFFGALRAGFTAPFVAIGKIPEVLATGFKALFAPQFELVESLQLPDGSQIRAPGIRVARDGVVTIPVGARREVFDIGDGPVKIGDREYTRGSFVFNGTDWLLDGEGQTDEDSFGGLRLADGGKIPIKVRSSEYGVIPVGIEWRLLEGKRLVASSPTQLPGFGTIFAGSFTVSNGAFSFAEGSIYQEKDDLYATYLMPAAGNVIEQSVRIEGNQFRLVLNQMKLGTGELVQITNAQLGGVIENGVAVFDRREADVGLLLKNGSMTARGAATINWTERGIQLTGYLDGDMAFVMTKGAAGAKSEPASNTKVLSGRTRTLVPGDYTVLSTNGMAAHLRGRVAITESGLLPFTDGAQFSTTEKAVLWKSGVAYNSGRSIEKFLVAGGEVAFIPPGAAAYMPDRTIRMGVETLVVSRLGIEIKDQKDWNRAEAFDIREVLLRPGAGGKYQAEVWHEGTRLAILKTQQVGTTLILVDHDGEKRPISLVPGGVIERNLDVEIGTKQAIKGVLGGYYDKVRGHVGRFSMILSSAGARTVGAYEKTSFRFKTAISPLTAMFQPVFSMGLAATLVGGQPAEARAKTYMKMANALDGAIMVGNYKIAANNSLLANSRALSPNQQAAATLVNGFLVPAGALTEFLGVHSLAYYDRMGSQGRVMEAAIDDLKVGGRNAAIGGVVGGLVAYFGKPVLILAGLGFGTMTALGSSASSLRGRIAEGVGASSLMFLGASMMKRRPTSGLYGAARVRAAFKSAGVSALDNTFGGVGLIENGLGRMHMSLVGGERAAQLGMSGVKGVKFAGLTEGRVQMEISSEGGRIPSLSDLKNIAQKAHDQKLTVEIMFGDRASVRAFQRSPELMSLVGPEGLQNLKVIGKYEVKLAERHKERLLEQKDYHAALKVKKEAALTSADNLFASNETGIKFWEGRRQGVNDVGLKLKESFSKGEVSEDGLVAKIQELVPGWKPSRELMGELRGAEAALRGIERGGEGLAQGPQDAAGGVGFLQRLSNRYKELVQGNRREVRQAGGAGQTDGGITGAIERGLAAERLANQAERLANQAVGFIDDKISFLRTENEGLVKQRPGLQNEIRVAGERAQLYQNRADKVGKRIEGLLQNLGAIQERITYWDSATFQEQVASPLRLTPEWKKGTRVSVRELLTDWKKDVSRGLDPAYTPYPFNFNKPKAGNIFDAVVESRAPPQLIGELLNVLGDGDGKVQMVSVRGSAEIAQRFIDAAAPERPSGVLGEKLNKNARQGQAVYLTARVGAGLKELEFHGSIGTHYNVYELDLNKARVLDLTDPRIIDLFRPEYGDDYKLTAKSAHQARLAGYDAVMYESVRDPGALNFAVIERHDVLLRVDQKVHSIPGSSYRAGKEALAAQRGAILVPTTGEVQRPLRSLWNRLLGRKETLTNAPTNGPPTVRTNGDNIDIPLTDSVVRREPPAPTLNAMVGNDMGFENGRPMSADNPNIVKGPPNQFKDFLENQTSQKSQRPPLSEKPLPAHESSRALPIQPKPVNYESFGIKTSNGQPASWERLNEVLSPPMDKAYFWSGRSDGIGGEVNANRISQNTGGITLEELLKSKNITMPVKDHPMTRAAWDEVSRIYARNAAGTVRVVLGDEVRQGSTWNRIEFKTLKENPMVREIIAIDPKTREERRLFSR